MGPHPNSNPEIDQITSISSIIAQKFIFGLFDLLIFVPSTPHHVRNGYEIRILKFSIMAS